MIKNEQKARDEGRHPRPAFHASKSVSAMPAAAIVIMPPTLVPPSFAPPFIMVAMTGHDCYARQGNDDPGIRRRKRCGASESDNCGTGEKKGSHGTKLLQCSYQPKRGATCLVPMLSIFRTKVFPWLSCDLIKRGLSFANTSMAKSDLVRRVRRMREPIELRMMEG